MNVNALSKESYVFMIDSSRRNKKEDPESNQYTISINSPFQNVCSFELIQAYIPRSEYNIDTENNTLEYTLDNQPRVYTLTVPPADYTLPQLTTYMNEHFQGGVTVQPATQPYTLSNRITIFRNTGTFTVLRSPLCESLGLEEQTSTKAKGVVIVKAYESRVSPSLQEVSSARVDGTFSCSASGKLHRVVVKGVTADDTSVRCQVTVDGMSVSWYPALTPIIDFGDWVDVPVDKDTETTIGFERIDSGTGTLLLDPNALSVEIDTEPWSIVPSNLVNLTGKNSIVFVRCKEIEALVFRDRFNETNIHTGLGFLRMSSLGLNEARQDYFEPFPPRVLNLPVRLDKFTFRIETPSGKLYNTRGLDHQLLCRITYYKSAYDISNTLLQ